MKTVVKIDPEKEYNLAKDAIRSIAASGQVENELSKLDGSVDNLKTVINVLIERLTPKPRPKPKKVRRRRRPRFPREEFDKLPSEKFPELEVREETIRSEDVPQCVFCQQPMKESGLFKVSEKLEIIPKQYYIVRHKRVIYNCGHCNGSLVNARPLPSIIPQSNYGDTLILDVALSKYCDLLPMERYSAIAAREGVAGLPPNSLIGLTHALAAFLIKLYEKIKEEVLASRILLADETPHNMLEGDDSGNWHLWAFACKTAVCFEAHDTRSGDVPLSFLMSSLALYLLTDGYSGYKRAARLLRELHNSSILEVHCNAHAVRYFKDASVNWPEETAEILESYGKIYALERGECQEEEKKKTRAEMEPHFAEIKRLCESAAPEAVAKSSFEKAANYFLNHFEGLTRCVGDIEIPLDNNLTERILRSYVVGRKTWYGTHSKRGAHTNAVLFSLVESCKINGINPRNYFQWIVERIHKKLPLVTPSGYASLLDSG